MSKMLTALTIDEKTIKLPYGIMVEDEELDYAKIISILVNELKSATDIYGFEVYVDSVCGSDVVTCETLNEAAETACKWAIEIPEDKDIVIERVNKKVIARLKGTKKESAKF